MLCWKRYVKEVGRSLFGWGFFKLEEDQGKGTG